MPVERQKWITRADLRARPDVLFLFGDNNERKGYGGQAKEMRDEPNACGIRTKWRGGMSWADFFHDDQQGDVLQMIADDLTRPVTHLHQGGTVVIPTDGLGTGLSKLPETAPKIHAWLEQQIAKLETTFGVSVRD